MLYSVFKILLYNGSKTSKTASILNYMKTDKVKKEHYNINVLIKLSFEV